MNFIITLLILILILGIIVLIHEFGHFIAAKKSGIYVDEFSIGMGPVLFKIKPKKSETTYSIRAFPVGGFVAMAEVESEELKIKKDRVLDNKGFFTKFIVLIMGIFLNFVLAIILLFINGLIYGSPDESPIIGSILEGSPANIAGIETGDEVISINDVSIANWDDIILEISAKKLQDDYKFEVKKSNGQSVIYHIVPEVEKKDDNETRVFGIGKDTSLRNKGFKNAINYAFDTFIGMIKTIFRILGSLFKGSVSVNSLSGPVGIFTIIDKVKAQGLETLIYLTAYLSINVATINLLPFPVFDGGKILIYVIQAISKKKLNQNIESIINFIGFGLLIILMLFITFNDIIKLL